MQEHVKGLLAKVWGKETVDLDVGHHYFDETLTVRISGTVEKQQDQLVAPTTSIPLVATLAFFWQKCGVTRDAALKMLKEAIVEAMTAGKDTNEHIEARIKDVEGAIQAVKKDLIDNLPKVKRSGRLLTKDLNVEVTTAPEELIITAA